MSTAPRSLAERLANAAPTTVFERMSGLARELGAINLGQGFPDMEEPPELLAAAQRALVDHPNQYPPMRGLPELRRAICDYYAREQGLAVSEDCVVVTSGGTEALAASLLALVQPGDEVVLIQPLYDAYLPLVQWAGGAAKLVSLTPPDWTLPLEALAAAIGPNTRGIVLNTPNNPTGTSLDHATLSAIGEIAEAHDLWVLCDEVWEGMILDRTRHVSPIAVPKLAERAVKVGSAGKIFSLTGWKIGWAVAAQPLAAAIAGKHQFLTFTTATPLQRAVAEGLALPGAWHEAHRARYTEAKARLVRGLEGAGYVLLPGSATWFVTIDLAASGLPADDVAIAEMLIREAGVASIPVSAFYAEAPERGYLRLCFAKEAATLDSAVERLARFRQQQGE
jgi:N-succinyldiaminopimelate aminotransferase